MAGSDVVECVNLQKHGHEVMGILFGHISSAQLSNCSAVCSKWSTVTTMALLIHGDASMSGLGIVPETLQLSRLPGYSIGGSVHIVINNQVGFTTLPFEGRSSLHSTDCAKAAGLPVIHAFADCPDSVVAAMQTAARWRHRFRSDIVVDVCGYRRNGHNEQDNPALTLPVTQPLIQQHQSVVSTYAERLMRDQVVSEQELAGWEAKILSRYEDGAPHSGMMCGVTGAIAHAGLGRQSHQTCH